MELALKVLASTGVIVTFAIVAFLFITAVFIGMFSETSPFVIMGKMIMSVLEPLLFWGGAFAAGHYWSQADC